MGGKKLPAKKGSKKDEGTKKKIEESMDKRMVKENENKKELRKLETKLIEKEYKEGLKDYMEQRLFDFKYKLKHIDTESKLTLIEIDKLIRGKYLIGNILYSAEELAMLFDYYRDFISEINKVTRYVPTKKNFCAFASISSATYENYLIEGDSQRIETMKMIDDYITDISLTLAQNREIDNVTTIYRSKAEHGMVEATAPIVIKQEHDIDLESIKKSLNLLKSGKSLKAIELTKDDYNVEGGNK